MEEVKNALEGLTTPGAILQWVIIAALIAIILYKAWPDIKARLEGWRKSENVKEDIVEKVEEHDRRLDDVEEKIGRDYREINGIKKTLDAQEEKISQSLEERELIIKSMLATLKGLQEIGANGPTKTAQKEIEDFLCKMAHDK